jgi:hypothetical protein
MRLALILLLFGSLSAVAADPQQEFRDELTRLSESSKELQPAQIYSVARKVFSTKSAENKARVDDWLASLAPFSEADGYTEEANMQRPVSLGDADKSVSVPGQSDRLFMQGVNAEDIVWLALDQAAGMKSSPEKQSQKVVRAYVRPQIKLVSREGPKVVIAIFDFDHLIQVTTIQTTSGVLLPLGYRILKK